MVRRKLPVGKIVTRFGAFVSFLPVVAGAIGAYTVYGEQRVDLALLVLGLGAAITSSAFVFTARAKGKSPQALATWGHLGIAVLIGGYAVLVTLLGWLGPLDLPSYVWAIIVVFAASMLGLCTVYSRWASLGRADIETGAQLAFFGAVFLLGAVVIGTAGASAGLGLVALREGHQFTAATLFVEAAGIALLGLALLIARHVVVGMTMFAVGVMVSGFGLASIVGGDTMFGSAVLAIALSTVLSGIATWKLSAYRTPASYILTSTCLAYGAIASVAQKETVFAAVFTVVAIVLAVTAVLALKVGEVADLFRHPNSKRAWGPRRYAVTAIGVEVGAIASTVWLTVTATSGQRAGVFSVGGILAALVAVNSILVIALARIGRNASRPPSPIKHQQTLEGSVIFVDFGRRTSDASRLAPSRAQ